jgi:hypothetical protein
MQEAQQLHAQRPTIASMVEEEVAKQVMVARLQVGLVCSSRVFGVLWRGLH